MMRATPLPSPSLAAIAALILLSPAAALARDLVVDNLRGSDSQNDRGLVAGPATFGPYRSIGRALAALQPGDRLVLTPTGEPYREMISLVGPMHSGTEQFPLEIVGNGAVLDGALPPRADAWSEAAPGLWRYDASPPGFGQLLLDGRLLQRVAAPESGELPRLQPLQWSRVGPHLLFRPADLRLPIDYPLEVTELTTGITLYNVRHVVIRDLVVRGFRLDGINAHDRARDIELVGVTSRHNGRAGITVAGSSRVLIDRSQAVQNGESPLRVEGLGVAMLGQVDWDADVEPTVVNGGRVVVLPQQDGR